MRGRQAAANEQTFTGHWGRGASVISVKGVVRCSSAQEAHGHLDTAAAAAQITKRSSGAVTGASPRFGAWLALGAVVVDRAHSVSVDVADVAGAQLGHLQRPLPQWPCASRRLARAGLDARLEEIAASPEFSRGPGRPVESVLAAFQNEGRGALAVHEAVAAGVERPEALAGSSPRCVTGSNELRAHSVGWIRLLAPPAIITSACPRSMTRNASATGSNSMFPPGMRIIRAAGIVGDGDVAGRHVR